MNQGGDEQLMDDAYQFNQFDPDWTAPTLMIEGTDQSVVRKRHTSDEHGIVYCKNPMNGHN